MSKHTFEVTPPKNIKDAEVIAQLPELIVNQLGQQLETGYDLRLSRRDLFFENGTVQYNPYRPTVTVSIDLK